MAFFEELGRKAKDVAAVAADKAKDVAAVAADKARETTELRQTPLRLLPLYLLRSLLQHLWRRKHLRLPLQRPHRLLPLLLLPRHPRLLHL